MSRKKNHVEEDTMDTADHQTRMQELMKIREVRALKQEITHLTREQLK